MRGIRLSGVVVALLVATLAIQGLAALEADWSASGVTTVTDPEGDNTGGNAADLLSVSHVFQNGAHYFKLRTLGVPDQDSFADYMLNFDWTAGGINAAQSYYVASGLVGIDFMLDAHYFQENLDSNHYHPIDLNEGSLFATLPMANYGVEYRTETDGTQFLQEWKVPYSFFTDTVGMSYGEEVTLYAATMVVHPSIGTTFDTASGLQFAAIPEPATFSMMALFGLATWAIRRMRIRS